MKFINFKLGIFLLIFTFILGAVPSAFADNEMDLEDSSGDNIHGDDIFNESNIFPGWSESETINVQNESDESEVDLYITFDVDGGEKLAEAIKIYVVRKSDGSYRVGGSGDKYTLEKASGEDLFIGKLDAGDDEDYKIKVKFDEDAGNEYQNLATEFDIDFEIEGRTPEGLTEEEIFTYQDRTVTGETPEDEIEDEVEEVEEDEPKSVIKVNKVEDKGIVAGEQTCQDKWPLWVWILILVVYGGLVSLIGNSTDTKDENASSIFWQAVLMIVTLVIWYFFDVCRLYIWVPILTIIGGAIIATIFYKGEEVTTKE
ncbi:MAG: hypothetical protein KAT32_04710 [Candidatus Moranbacteria bacterium]|nr:hypothetical protein [Candidatus Moranbacteria bacterium]